MALIAKDSAHMVDEKRYRGFYSVVQVIVKKFEDLQAEGNTEPTYNHLCHLDKYRLRRLKRKLDATYEAAFATDKPPVCEWEDVLLLTGGVLSTISAAPGLGLLKPAGTVLGQISELVKTKRGNKAEYGDLLRLASGILADLTSKMQRSDIKPTEDMESGVIEFERTLVRVRDSITGLTRESRTKSWGRLLFASKTKEELAGLRKELGDAHNRFMAGNMFAVCLDVKAVSCDVQALHDSVQAVRLELHYAKFAFFF
ncbi:hypothetical protein PQX77_003662 [Marasmius sp. AFHP31]|nr:hypothetical protein PQX77_003662 [Marasmius sp. AFHP31]